VKIGRLQIGIVPTYLARSMAFYRDVLGLPYDGPVPVGEGKTLHNFTVGDAILKLMESPGEARPGPPTEEIDELAGFRGVTMDVDELDAMVGRCEASGAAIPMPIVERRPGLRVAIVLDPDGNRVELVERT
jgi:predicted enzyme related to lactoylglutathione lyase